LQKRGELRRLAATKNNRLNSSASLSTAILKGSKKGPALLQRGAFDLHEIARKGQLMKSRIILTLSALCGFVLLAVLQPAARAQDEITRPPLKVPEAADTALQFVPPGWRAEEGPPKEMDLNGDGRPDVAIHPARRQSIRWGYSNFSQRHTYTRKR
jgi:hypothetical protein